MTATADLIIERRRMRRRLALWRILAIVALIVAIVVAIATTGGFGGTAPSGPHVARLEVSGLIASDRERHERLSEIADDDDVKALIVRINSPGGTVTGSEELYEDIRDIADGKPVVTQMIDAAASGGYITALAADHIVAYGGTITGSIGVVAQAPNIARLLDDNGIDVFQVKSSQLKAEPGFLTEIPEGAREAQQRLIDDSYQWFRDLVSDRRGLTGRALDTVADGRVFTGRLALENGLVDSIGGTEAVDRWLEEEHGIARDLPRRQVTWGDRELPFFLEAGLRAVGLDAWLEARLGPLAATARPGVGLWAVMY